MFRWVLSGLFVAILAFGGLASAPSAGAQTSARPAIIGMESTPCKLSAVNRCKADCADVGLCVFGCEIGGASTLSQCDTNCQNLGDSCLSNCRQTVEAIHLCHFPTVGGVVSGLGAGQSVVLQNSGGAPLTVSANGAFTFPMWVTLNDAYAVTVSAQPADQTCMVANGSGVADSAAVIPTPYGVTNIAVTCVNSVPTMSEWGKILLVGMLAIGGLLMLSPMVLRTGASKA